jgi:hypothetical protein
MTVPLINFSDIFDSVKSKVFNQECLSSLSSITSVEQIALFLEGLEKVVLSIKKDEPCQASKVMYYLLENKLALLILAISKHGKTQYINMLSSSNRKYTNVFDQTLKGASALSRLYHFFFREYGISAVGIFGAFMGIPNEVSNKMLERLLKNKGSTNFQFFFDRTTDIYRFVCAHDENAVLRVAEFFGAHDKLLYTWANPLEIIWSGLEMSHVPIVTSLFDHLHSFFEKISLLEISNNQQFALFRSILSRSKCSGDRAVFGMLSFAAGFVETLEQEALGDLQNNIIQHISELLANHIKDPQFPYGKYEDALYKSFVNVLTNEQKSLLSQKICTDLGRCSGKRFFCIVQFFSRYISSNDDFINLLGSKLFAADDSCAFTEYDSSKEKSYEDLRQESFLGFYWDRNRKFTPDQRKGLMKFASYCG